MLRLRRPGVRADAQHRFLFPKSPGKLRAEDRGGRKTVFAEQRAGVIGAGHIIGNYQYLTHTITCLSPKTNYHVPAL